MTRRRNVPEERGENEKGKEDSIDLGMSGARVIMGSYEKKTEKKRLKAEHKTRKKQAKAEGSKPADEKTVERPPVKAPVPDQVKEKPWYKDPNWIRAAVAIASLIVAVIAIVLSFFR